MTLPEYRRLRDRASQLALRGRASLLEATNDVEARRAMETILDAASVAWRADAELDRRTSAAVRLGSAADVCYLLALTGDLDLAERAWDEVLRRSRAVAAADRRAIRARAQRAMRDLGRERRKPHGKLLGAPPMARPVRELVRLLEAA
jgi:hypothetical protein